MTAGRWTPLSCRPDGHTKEVPAELIPRRAPIRNQEQEPSYMDTENTTVTRLDETVAAVTADPLPPEVLVTTELDELARSLDGLDLADHAASVRSVIARLDGAPIILDNLIAEALNLAAHADHVTVPAKATGEALLRVAGGESA